MGLFFGFIPIYTLGFRGHFNVFVRLECRGGFSAQRFLSSNNGTPVTGTALHLTPKLAEFSEMDAGVQACNSGNLIPIPMEI